MSFPRAKIQRFNDAKSCATPSGSYDPKFEGKVEGAVIEKRERFMSQSSSSTESPGNLCMASSICKSGYLNCLPIFRTPQLPRKQNKQVNSAPQIKAKLNFEQLEKSDSAGKVDAQLYAALLVERDNKDATIKENEAFIEHLRECIRKFDKELQDSKSQEQKLVRNEEEQNKRLSDLKLDLHKAKEICCNMEKSLDEKELSLLTYKQNNEDLLLQITNLKEKEIENRSSYEVNIKELIDYYKRLEEEVGELKAAVTMKEEHVEKLKEHVGILSDGNLDLNCKLNKKQQLIFCLQGKLSCATLELEECKSENEKMANNFRHEKDSEHDVEQMAQEFHQLKTRRVAADEQIKMLRQELEAARGSMARLEKDEIEYVLQNYHCDCKVESESGDCAGEKVCKHQERIAEMNPDIREFKNILDAVVESRILGTKEDFQRSLAEAKTRASLAEHWESKCKELEALIGPFREQLEIFKEEFMALELKKEAAEEQMRELSLQYAEILGHQNHKQKIKHLIKLKEQNFELIKETERLEEQVRSQRRIIDKLKRERSPAVKQETERLEEQVRSQRRIIDKLKRERSPAVKQVLQQLNPPSNSKGKKNLPS